MKKPFFTSCPLFLMNSAFRSIPGTLLFFNLLNTYSISPLTIPNPIFSLPLLTLSPDCWFHLKFHPHTGFPSVNTCQVRMLPCALLTTLPLLDHFPKKTLLYKQCLHLLFQTDFNIIVTTPI